MHLRNYFKTKQSALIQNFHCSNWSWKIKGRLQFRKKLTCQCTKVSQWENSFFLIEKNFQSWLNFTIWNPVCTLPLRILLKPWTLWFKKDIIRAKTVLQIKCLEECKKRKFTLQMKDMVLNSLVRTWDTTLELISAMNLVWCWEEKDLTNLKLIKLWDAYTLL